MPPSNYPERQNRLNWLAELYRAYAAELQRSIYSRVGDLALAEDLTSTVFLKALRWLSEDQPPESARGWLYATARTTIADYWQGQSQYEMHSLSDLEMQFLASESAQYLDQQAEARAHHLLSLLPERDRTILTLRYLQGYSASEIAEVLGTSASHIRVLQLRALRRAAQLEIRERKSMQESAFDSFAGFMTPESRRVLDLAREEMLNLKQWWIGTEHLLWGLASEGSLASFLTPLGITHERIHTGIVFIFERHASQGTPVPEHPFVPDATTDPLNLLTPRAKQVIILAGEEAKNQGEKSIRPTHLLLGLMNEGEGIGAGLLRSLGISLLQVRTVLTPPAATQTCAFCGRSGSQVARFFPSEVGISESHSPGVFICDQCVRRFYAMLENV
ncbi:MAG TPA: sigma-70 family RNA polymerase sigma factor [Ktedonobacteraceae bacterium]|jgi:RNA polymerase sigma-70 factor (ECF subfamily)|nr:sigma-70 family RNA polymerase sigma factor [Ktedonobacteraceae bacterium]